MKFTSSKVRIKRIVWERDNYICKYCGKDLKEAMIDKRRKKPEGDITVDHVNPKINGGTWDLDNLVTSCKRCNQEKGAKLSTGYLQ